MTVRRLLGAALTLPLLIGGLVLVTAGPAAACTCATSGSDAGPAAVADAVFVGTLISQVHQIDPRVEQARRELTRTSDQRVLVRARVLVHVLMNNPSRTVWTFQVTRVYKGAVGKRQEIVTPMGTGTCGRKDGLFAGPGPFLVFAWRSSLEASHKYHLQSGQYLSDISMCSPSRLLADGGEPDLGGLSAGEPGWPDSWAVGVGVLVAGVAASLGLAALRARRRASAD